MGWLIALLVLASDYEVPALRSMPTYYCGCTQTADGFDAASCGYRPRNDNARAHRIEWEHIVPASTFGRTFAAWTEGHERCVDSRGRPYKGRRCAQKVEPLYRRMELDHRNLVPTIGELNGRRSNLDYGVVVGEPREYGACDFEVGSVAEPAPHVRGDVARVYRYMGRRYPGRVPLDPAYDALLDRWAKHDPIDATECRRIRAVDQKPPWPWTRCRADVWAVEGRAHAAGDRSSRSASRRAPAVPAPHDGGGADRKPVVPGEQADRP